MAKKVHYLETIEQARALMEPTRQQIIREMSAGATTSKEIARAIGGSVPKIHYHLKELEKHGLVRVTGTTRKGNLVESHYQPVARSFRSRTQLDAGHEGDVADARDLLTRTLLVAASALEDAVVELVNLVEETDPEGFARRLRPVLLDDGLNVSHETLQLTPEEYQELLGAYRALLARYARNRRSAGRKAVDVFWMTFPNGEAVRTAIA